MSAQLAKLSFTPNENYNGPATITVHTVETETSKPLGADGIISITVEAVDDAPVLTVPKTVTTSEDTAFSFTDSNLVSVTDVESDNVSVTLTAANGTVTAGGHSGSEITLTGSPTEVSAQLAKLSFTPNENYNGPATITVHTVETETSKPLGADGIISITVTAVENTRCLH